MGRIAGLDSPRGSSAAAYQRRKDRPLRGQYGDVERYRRMDRFARGIGGDSEYVDRQLVSATSLKLAENRRRPQ